MYSIHSVGNPIQKPAGRSISPVSLGSDGFDWYVDSTLGSDSNSGTSEDKPFQNITQLMSVLDDGDTVGLAKGSTWRQSINSPSLSNVRINAYGQGKLPVLDCADVADNQQFSATAETTNVYQITWVVETGGDGNFISAWEDSVRLRWATSVANCDSTPGTFYATSVGTTFTVYVHPYNSTNPTSDSKTYELSRRNHGVRTGTSWIVSDVRTRRNHHNNGSLILESGSKAIRCIAEDGVKHNALGAAGTEFDSCIAYKCAYPERGDGTLFVGFALDGSGTSVAFRNCMAVLDADTRNFGSAVGPGSITGYYVHTSGEPGSFFDSASLIGSLAAFCNTGFGVADVVEIIEQQNRMHQNLFASQVLAAGATYTSTDCWVQLGTGGSSIIRGLALSVADINISGLRMYFDRGSVDGAIFISSGANVEIASSTFVMRSQTGYQYAVRLTSSGASLSFHNNLVIGNQDGGEVAALAYHNPIDVDQNIYAGSDACDFELNGENHAWVEWYLDAARLINKELQSAEAVVTLSDVANGDFSIDTSNAGVGYLYGVQNSPTYLDVPTYEQLDLL